MRIAILHSVPPAIQIGAVRMAESAWQRTRGLIGREPLGEGEGLLIARCRSVHTFGMACAIDVVFIDASGCVVRIVEALCPMRLAMCFRGASVLELAAGQAHATGIRVGMQLAGWSWKNL